MSQALAARYAKKVMQVTTRLKADVTTKAQMFALIDSEEDLVQEILMAFS